MKNTKWFSDTSWILIWFSGILIAGIWDLFFLNKPTFDLILKALAHSFFIALLVVLFSLLLSWIVSLLHNYFEVHDLRIPSLALTFSLNVIRSIPQIIGVLIGYILMTVLIESEIVRNQMLIMVLIAFTLSIFIFLELADLLKERIEFFKKLDFYPAMQVCGIKEFRIVNIEILWKNSLAHIINKLISIFGISIFLQSSIDFILSVGLSTRVSSVNFPVTLGSLLAKIDSKQDILAVGILLTNPLYFHNIFFTHLQGVTVAFLITFTLLCIYKITDGFSERYKL